MCNMRTIGPAVSEKKIFETVDDGRRTDGRRTDDGAWVYYEGDSKSPRKSAAKLLVFMGNSRSLCMLYINIFLKYAQNLNKIG